MSRDHAQEPMAVTGGTNFAIQQSAAVAMQKVDQGGRLVPVYTDNNGQTREVRNSKDIDRWMGDNALGKPRMVEWTNRITGAKEWVPQRSVMRPDPVTGDVMDEGVVIREPEKLVPLGKKGDYQLPTEVRRTGTRLNDKGVAADLESRQKKRPGMRHGKYCPCIPCSMSDPDVNKGGDTGGLNQLPFLPSNR